MLYQFLTPDDAIPAQTNSVIADFELMPDPRHAHMIGIDSYKIGVHGRMASTQVGSETLVLQFSPIYAFGSADAGLEWTAGTIGPSTYFGKTDFAKFLRLRASGTFDGTQRFRLVLSFAVPLVGLFVRYADAGTWFADHVDKDILKLEGRLLVG